MNIYKKLLCTFIALLLMITPISLSFTVFASSTGTYIAENENGVNLYKSANESSIILAVMRKGTIIEVSAVSGRFGKTTYDSYTAWVVLDEVVPYAEKNDSISKISIVKKPDKLEYYEEEIFDPTGIEVLVYFTDGTNKTIKNPTIHAPSLMTEGEKSVNVMYEGHMTQFNIRVHRLPIDRIEVTKLPNISEVKEGLQPNLEGMVLTVFYTDGREPHTVENYTITGYDPYKIGAQTITLTYRYEDITTTLDINVVPKILIGLFVTTPPTKLDYYGDEREIKLDGLVLTANYDNATTAKVMPESAQCDNMELGENLVTLTYQGMTATYNITLHELDIIGFYVTEPKKSNYIKGEELDLDGLAIYYEYNSGSKKYITENYTMSSPNMNMVGYQTVEVRHGDYVASFAINIYGTNLKYDVNSNSKVEISDARNILRAAVSIDVFNNEQLLACGLGAGGKPTVSMSRQALRIAVKIEEAQYLF